MAIQQFRLSLLPKKGLLEKFKVLPEYLKEYQEDFNNEDQSIIRAYDNYWRSSNVESLSLKFKKILPAIESWNQGVRELDFLDLNAVSTTYEYLGSE